MFTADWDDLLYINSAYEDVWGASIAKLRASPRSFLEHIHPDDRAKAEESMRRLSDGEPTDIEYRVRVPGGETRWVRGVSEPIFDAEGEVIRIMGSVRDITRLKEREERFRSVFEESFDAMVIADDEGNYVSVNPAACELFGLEEEALLGRNVAEFAAPGYDVEEAWAEFQSGDDVTGQFPLQRPDGTVRIVEYSATADIVPGEHLSVLRDITDQVRQQRELRESQARYQTLVEDVLDTSSVGTIILDANFDVVWINAAMEEYFGIDRGDVLGKSQKTLVQTKLKQKFAEPESFARRVLQTYEANTSSETFEFKVQGEDPGTWRWLRHSSRPIRSGLYAGGRIEHYADITDIRTRDRQLKVLARVLRHNLHNKLNVVLGFADQISVSTSGPQRDRAQRIIRAATELLEVSDRQKEIVELISDDFELESVDLAALVHQQVAVVREAYPAAEITMRLPERAPVRAVEAIEQAIGELLENAARHCEGTPRIEVAIDEQPDAVTVSVQDRNEAIPDLEKAVLRGDVEIDQLAHSRGLGLWLVNWLVVRSEGTVAFEGAGDGNRVRITLQKAGP
ncbi:MAG: PAS domain S-box protein [Haloferacaceae archaeon]